MLQKKDEGRPVRVQVEGVTLEGSLSIPEKTRALVVFVHGSGSSRFSPRNQYVAGDLQAGGLGTLLFDLLTPEEEEIDRMTRKLRFDIDLLARRTIGTLDWLVQQPELQGFQFGTFGSSTGAAAALIAAAERPALVGAVVSRGGRPDLARRSLALVRAPTLLIVGEMDEQVLQLNREAMELMSMDVTAELRIVQGATHLFEEAGALERASELSRDWFLQFLAAPAPGME